MLKERTTKERVAVVGLQFLKDVGIFIVILVGLVLAVLVLVSAIWGLGMLVMLIFKQHSEEVGAIIGVGSITTFVIWQIFDMFRDYWRKSQYKTIPDDRDGRGPMPG